MTRVRRKERDWSPLKANGKPKNNPRKKTPLVKKKYAVKCVWGSKSVWKTLRITSRENTAFLNQTSIELSILQKKTNEFLRTQSFKPLNKKFKPKFSRILRSRECKNKRSMMKFLRVPIQNPLKIQILKNSRMVWWSQLRVLARTIFIGTTFLLRISTPIYYRITCFTSSLPTQNSQTVMQGSLFHQQLTTWKTFSIETVSSKWLIFIWLLYFWVTLPSEFSARNFQIYLSQNWKLLRRNFSAFWENIVSWTNSLQIGSQRISTNLRTPLWHFLKISKIVKKVL